MYKKPVTATLAKNTRINLSKSAMQEIEKILPTFTDIEVKLVGDIVTFTPMKYPRYGRKYIGGALYEPYIYEELKWEGTIRGIPLTTHETHLSFHRTYAIAPTL